MRRKGRMRSLILYCNKDVLASGFKEYLYVQLVIGREVKVDICSFKCRYASVLKAYYFLLRSSSLS